MSKKRNINLSNPTKNILGVVLSSFAGIALSITLTFIISYIISKTSVLSIHLKIYFSVCVGLGSIFGGFISSKKCNFKGLLSGFLSSIPNSLIVIVFMVIFSNGQLKESTVIIFLLIIICSTLGGIIGANTKRRK
ncbi:MAG: TIGR04086 family membrane protein [Clostridia bacterium]|nr:TIGR04086 family membrane protein [Clostridia bacterium]